MSEDLGKRDGVGGVADEPRLVDVEAYADEAAREVDALEVVLDEDAAKFLILIIDIVGPLDADVCGVLCKHFADGDGNEFTEGELFARLDALGG